MSFATALLLTVLCVGTDQGLQPGAAPPPAPARAAEAGRREDRQAASGIIIAADIDGRVAIYDAERRLVVELDKPAGRQLQVALEPGAYEARLGGHASRRARFQIGDGQQLLLALPHFEAPGAGAPPAGHASGSHVEHPHEVDARHRIEVRFGGWGDGWYNEHGDSWQYSGSAQGAFGLEYLNFIRNDLGVGLAVTSLARAHGGGHGWDEGGAGEATCSIPVVVRWYPIRRLTRMRSVEPYVTGGIGPVFGVDTVYATDDDPRHREHDYVSSGRVGTAFGGRIGGGVDFRLGSTFTVGVGGAWNWDTGFHDDLWTGARPGGGEFTVSLGWNFGR
jgi:hypothetical protein